jgi:hypothetical protein
MKAKLHASPYPTRDSLIPQHTTIQRSIDRAEQRMYQLVKSGEGYEAWQERIRLNAMWRLARELGVKPWR